MVRLKVIQEPTTAPKQDCGTCRQRKICWEPGIRDEHVLINLLICRIQRGVDVNPATKALLQLVRPKLRNLAKLAARGSNMDMDTVLADMESKTIEFFITKYKHGEVGFPLHFIFGMRKGHMFHYANHYAKKAQQYAGTYILDKDVESRLDDSVDPDADDGATEETAMARSIIEDGITLTHQEYRVLKFCLENATEAKRPLGGLHIYLARVMGLNRSKVAKIYSDATKKLVKAVAERLQTNQGAL